MAQTRSNIATRGAPPGRVGRRCRGRRKEEPEAGPIHHAKWRAGATAPHAAGHGPRKQIWIPRRSSIGRLTPGSADGGLLAGRCRASVSSTAGRHLSCDRRFLRRPASLWPSSTPSRKSAAHLVRVPLLPDLPSTGNPVSVVSSRCRPWVGQAHLLGELKDDGLFAHRRVAPAIARELTHAPPIRLVD